MSEKCFECGKDAKETSSCCSVFLYLDDREKKELSKITKVIPEQALNRLCGDVCEYDFYCNECMDRDNKFCLNCSKILSSRQKEFILKFLDEKYPTKETVMSNIEKQYLG